ncbi:MAG: hypothetical protein GF411_09155 [Candidatus Lokiarchaeota archaeon]|nr:hypothetical protein [Candidatus Lokiarchaeota archaeon]
MTVWRINICPNSKEGLDPREFCIKNNILGIGWQIEEVNKPIEWKEYLDRAKAIYGKEYSRGWNTAMHAIGNRMKINDLCWTRDKYGNYYIGRVTGNWEYRYSREYVEADIVNVRTCDWKKVGKVDHVPGKVVNSFRGRTLQAVSGDSIEIYSNYTYYGNLEKIDQNKIYKFNEGLYSLLSADDLEDIVGIYLQSIGYVFIPSSCKINTSEYEYVMKNKVDGTKAIAQVKRKSVPLNAADYSRHKCKVFLFAVGGQYGDDISENVECLDPNKIRDFILKNLKTMPDKVNDWVEISEKILNS